MEKNYRRTKTTVSLIQYHFVFCPRYRRKILVQNVEKRFKELVEEICQEKSWVVVALETMPDHCHLFINTLPTDSPASIMAKIKGVSSRKLRKEFRHLSHLPSVWTRSYFVCTAGNVSSETIQRYIEEQKKRG